MDSMQESTAPETTAETELLGEPTENSSENQSTETEQNTVQEEPLSREEFNQLTQIARNQAEELRRLRQQSENINQRLAPPLQADPDISDEDLANAPAKSMREMMQREIAKAIAPMAQTFQQQQSEKDFSSRFDGVINNLGGNVPQYKDALLPAVREILGNAPPTQENIHTATVIAIGNATIAANRNSPQIPANTDMTKNPPTNRTTRPLPANSPNRVPSSNTNKSEMTEQMRKMMVRSGYQAGEEKEFLSALNSEEVSFDYRGGKK